LFERSYECICYLLLIVVSVDELDIDSIDEFQKRMAALHLKPEGEEPECYCDDICKMEVSGDPELGDTVIRNNRLCCEVSSQVLNEF
jgi:hypothetical protein